MKASCAFVLYLKLNTMLNTDLGTKPHLKRQINLKSMLRNPRLPTLVVALGICGLVTCFSIYKGLHERAALESTKAHDLATEQANRAEQLVLGATTGTLTAKEGLPRAISDVYGASGIGTTELANVIDQQERVLLGESSNLALLYVSKRNTGLLASKEEPLTVTPNPLSESFDLAGLNRQYKGFFPDADKGHLASGLTAFGVANEEELNTRTPNPLRLQSLPDGLSATLPSDKDGSASIFSVEGRKAAQEFTGTGGKVMDLDAAYLYRAYKTAVADLSVNTSEYQAMGKAYLFLPLFIALNAEGSTTKLTKGDSLEFKATEAESLLLSSVGSGSVAAASYLLQLMSLAPTEGGGIEPALVNAANLWIAGQLESELLSPRGFAVIKERQLSGMTKGLAILAENAPELRDSPNLGAAFKGHLAASVYNDGLLAQATSVQALSSPAFQEFLKFNGTDNAAVFGLFGKLDASTGVALKIAPSVFEFIDARKELVLHGTDTSK